MVKPVKLEFVDMSAQVYGKYQHCGMAKDGMWYAERDLEYAHGGGCQPKPGALPDPNMQESPELLAKARAMHERSAEKLTAQALKSQRKRPWWNFWRRGQ